MNKQKTRKSVSKRFKITKTGKVLHRASYSRHLKANKSKSNLRGKKIMRKLKGKYKKKIKKMIGKL